MSAELVFALFAIGLVIGGVYAWYRVTRAPKK